MSTNKNPPRTNRTLKLLSWTNKKNPNVLPQKQYLQRQKTINLTQNWAHGDHILCPIWKFIGNSNYKIKKPWKLGSGKILTGYQTEREGINYLWEKPQLCGLEERLVKEFVVKKLLFEIAQFFDTMLLRVVVAESGQKGHLIPDKVGRVTTKSSVNGYLQGRFGSNRLRGKQNRVYNFNIAVKSIIVTPKSSR